MEFWKLGCNWGTGKPDFFGMLKQHSFVICASYPMNVNDVVALTKGHTVTGIARIIGNRECVLDHPELQDVFNQYEIGFDSGNHIANAHIWEIPQKEQFQYQLQQGICKIQHPDILRKLGNIMNSLMSSEMISHYTSVLKGNHNLVLTGAPGTGKTYLAKQIAKSMGAEWEIVQFHPSYDYSDFIEGLRPFEKVMDDGSIQIGFRREDGLFKAFCKKALKRSAIDAEQALEAFKDDLQKSPIVIPCFKKPQKLITVKLVDGRMRIFPQRCKAENGYNCSDKDVLDYLKKGIYSAGHDTYQPSVGEYIKKTYFEQVDYDLIKALLLNEQAKNKLFEDVYAQLVNDVANDEVSLKTKEAYYGRGESQYSYVISDSGVISPVKLGNTTASDDKKSAPKSKVFAIVEYYLLNPSEWAFESKENFNKIIEQSKLDGKSVDYYVWPVVNEMIRRVLYQFPRPYVFIIDEINRGEVSKIFGEMFYSLDSGYRGINGRLKTQYQNLVPKDDEFSEGFYIPNNVFVIGTMNDIDRSVECIDFAMRRRFAWKEVGVKSRQNMLWEAEAWGVNGIPSDNVIREIINRMDNLNSAIVDTYPKDETMRRDKIGLSESYQIGPAYFLKYNRYNDFELLWENHIKGVLFEYLRGSNNIDTKMAYLKSAYNDIYER